MIRLLTLPPLLDRGGEVTQSAIRPCRLLIGIPRAVMHPSLLLENAIPKAFGIALQILLRPSVDAIERFLDILDRVRYAEAKIAFAEVAERGAGQSSDTCVLE